MDLAEDADEHKNPLRHLKRSPDGQRAIRFGSGGVNLHHNSIRGKPRSAEVTRVVAAARGLRRSRRGEKSRNLLNRALCALSKDPHLVAEAATALSPSGRGVKSLSIQRGVHRRLRLG
jgi:hypothetical protein